MYPKSTQLISNHILYTLFTGQMVKQIERMLVKYLNQCVYLNDFSMTKCTQNQHSQLSKT